MFDRQILCIDCILSDEHKTKGGKDRHEMISIEKAAETELEQTLKEQNSRIAR
jgi:hypothetical protein